MLANCKVTINGVTYTLEEFKALIMEKGIGEVFKEDLSSLSSKLKAKYDFLNQEDSVMEEWAKLEAQKQGIEYTGTPEQINSLVYPPGQLTDYKTQETIRYNTFT